MHLDSHANSDFVVKLLAQGFVPSLLTFLRTPLPRRSHVPAALSRPHRRPNLSFLIMDHPRASNMALVLQACKKYQVWRARPLKILHHSAIDTPDDTHKNIEGKSVNTTILPDRVLL